MNLFKIFSKRVTHLPKSQPDWQQNGLQRLKERLRLLPDTDPLVPLLQQLIDQFAAIEIQAGLKANLSDGEAHRFRGRLGLAMDINTGLQELWEQSRKPKQT